MSNCHFLVFGQFVERPEVAPENVLWIYRPGCLGCLDFLQASWHAREMSEGLGPALLKHFQTVFDQVVKATHHLLRACTCSYFDLGDVHEGYTTAAFSFRLLDMDSGGAVEIEDGLIYTGHQKLPGVKVKKEEKGTFFKLSSMIRSCRCPGVALKEFLMGCLRLRGNAPWSSSHSFWLVSRVQSLNMLGKQDKHVNKNMLRQSEISRNKFI